MADHWIVDVKKGLWHQNPDSVQRSKEVSIYKVPDFLAQLNQSAYFPQMVRLGPLHHDPAHPEMLPHKLHAVQEMFEKTEGELKMFVMSEEEFEREVIMPILALAPKVRECYQQNIEYQDGYLAWMLTLDACFILEIFKALGCREYSDHCLFNRNTIEYTAYPIITDILMLENQIPLIVLLKILELKGQKDEAELQPAKDEASAFTELCTLVSGARIERLIYPFKNKQTDPPLMGIPGAKNSKHLLDLIRTYVIHSFKLEDDTHDQPCPTPEIFERREVIIPSSSELRRAGIKFTMMEGEFMEINIQKNRFHLPRIRISSAVETLLRNLMVMEICEANDRCVISRYVHLMCELIHSERDVSVLRKARIIKSYMGSDREVADLFKTLSTGITRSYEDPFAKVREDAYNHYRSKFKVMLAEFTDDHFSRPWRTVSVIAACLLLFFSAVQTIFSLHHKLLTN